MTDHRPDMSPVVEMTRRRVVGPTRNSRPAYVDLLPPCNQTCPAGEDIQAWLSLAQAGKWKQAWESLIRDNPLPAVHGRRLIPSRRRLHRRPRARAAQTGRRSRPTWP